MIRVVSAISGLLATIAFSATGQRVDRGSQKTCEITSPDSNIVVRIDVGQRLSYSVSFHQRPIILDSTLGLEFKDEPALGHNLTVDGVANKTVDRTWINEYGKERNVRDHYNEAVISMQESGEPHRKLDLIVRAYDEGAAFRYRMSGGGASRQFVLTREDTEFHFASDATVWAATYTNFYHPYEQEYTRRHLSDVAAGTIVGLPILAQISQIDYVAVAEAELTDWAGMYLKPSGGTSGLTLGARLSPRLDGDGLVKAHLPHLSPWRVLMIGSRPGDLIESELIVNLNPPSALADTSWIRPGKMAWDHWWSGDVKMDTETEEEFIHFAGDMGFAYQLVDWQWYGPFDKPSADITRPAPQVDMQQLLRFAKERHVRLWLWLHSNDVNRYLVEGKLDDVFSTYERWGIAGVKIDFMLRDDQEMVNWYETVVKLAAQHHLMVDFHGAYKPTGLRRTWPNLVTREGVLGNEYNKFSSRVTPEHKLTLPFTRMLVGPMDFTPGGFLNRSPEQFKQTLPTEVMGSRAQELALFVVYESPLECVADAPEHYRGQPGLEFLRVVPTVWEQTKVLDGAVGEHIVVARQSGGNWFLGGMTAKEATECGCRSRSLA